jgi:hypothetical protein
VKINLILALIVAFAASVAMVQAKVIYSFIHAQNGHARNITIGSCYDVEEHFENHEEDLYEEEDGVGGERTGECLEEAPSEGGED